MNTATLAIDLHGIRDDVAAAKIRRGELIEEVGDIGEEVAKLRADVARVEHRLTAMDSRNITQHDALMSVLDREGKSEAARSERWAVIVDRLTQEKVIFAFLALALLGVAAASGLKISGYGVTVDGAKAHIESSVTVDAVSDAP